MNASFEALQAARRDAAAVVATLDALIAEAARPKTEPDHEPLKYENGRLTDSGVRELRAMVDAKRTNAEIARSLAITPAAAANQRRIYENEKLAKKSARK